MKILGLLLTLACGWVWAQPAAPAAAAPGTNIIGVVTRVDAVNATLTIKTDAGAEVAIALQPNVSFRRVAPGETNLQNAAAIKLIDLAMGDRVLARGPGVNQANLVVVMSQSDIAKKQAADKADWEKRGVMGVVGTVGSDSLTVNSRSLTGASQVTITLAKTASVRRYAPDSINFADAKPGKLSDIKPGDQVRARGEKSADGSKLEAEELVSGTFKTVAGVVVSTDPQSGELKVTDLATKKPVTVKVSKESVLRKLAPPAAQAIAVRVRPELAAALKGKQGGPPADLQQLIDRSPNVGLAELHAGDAVVVSCTVGTSADRMTAITLLAGVEPILTKPGTQEMSLGSWNLDIGGGIGGP